MFNKLHDLTFSLSIFHLVTEILALEKPVTTEQLEIVAEAVGHRCYPLGRALGYKNAKIRNILSAYRMYDQTDSEKLLVVLEAWQDKEGRKATLGRLLEACSKIEAKGKVEMALAGKK